MDQKMKVERIDGRWLVNNSRFENLNKEEKEFLSQFISVMKQAFELESKSNVKIYESKINKL